MKKNILHVVDKMNMGGTENFLMNIFRKIDRKKINFYFLTHYKNEEYGYFDEEIKQLGGEIVNIPSRKDLGIVKYILQLIQVFKKHQIDVVHAHTTYHIGIVMLAACIAKVPIRIAHAHNTGTGEKGLIRFVYKHSMLFLINKCANKFAACSNAAAKHLFNEKNMKNYVFIPNAVDFDKFFNSNFDEDILKSSLNIPNEGKVIGHIGRFGKVKNHKFILELFLEALKKNKNYYLVLIGDGKDKQKYIDYAKKKGLDNNVRFLGFREDIPELLKIMDVFLLPSLYEGFGIVLLEAQAMGLHCIVSENIQDEVDLGLGLIHKHSLNEDISNWVSDIFFYSNKKIKDKNFIKNQIQNSPFMLDNVCNLLYKLYEV